jgi:hypothetical protein
LVKVVGSDESTQHYEPYQSQEAQAIQAQVDRLLALGGDKLVHLQAAVSEYLRRQQVLAEWAQAQHIDDHDSPGVIIPVD